MSVKVNRFWMGPMETRIYLIINIFFVKYIELLPFDRPVNHAYILYWHIYLLEWCDRH